MRPRDVVDNCSTVGPAVGAATTAPGAGHPAVAVPGTAASAVAPFIASPPPVVPVDASERGAVPVPSSCAASSASWDGLMPSPPVTRSARPRQRKRTASVAAQRAAAQRAAGGPSTTPSATPVVTSASPASAGDGGTVLLNAPTASPGATLTEDAAKIITASVTKGVRDGLRAVQTELSGLRNKVDAMGTTLSILCTTVNTQGVGSERTAQAVQQLHGTVRGGFSSMMNRVDAPAKADELVGRAPAAGTGTPAAPVASVGQDWNSLPLKAKQEVANKNLKTLSAVRDLCKKTLVQAMLTANVSSDAFLDAPKVKEHVHAAVRTILGVSEEVVDEYLDSSLYFPVRRAAGDPVKIRVSSKLGLVMPHLLQGIRRLVIPVYFNSLQMPVQKATDDLCRLWLASDKYTNSDVGTSSVTAALTTLCRRWGAKSRVIDQPAVGDLPHVVTTLGMYALVSLLVRNHLEDVIGTSNESRRADDDKKPTMHDQWRQELVRVSRFLPMDDKVHSGLRLVDGVNPERAETRSSDEAEEESAEQGECKDTVPLFGCDVVMGGTLSD